MTMMVLGTNFNTHTKKATIFKITS